MEARHGQHLHGVPDGDYLVPGDMELLERDVIEMQRQDWSQQKT